MTMLILLFATLGGGVVVGLVVFGVDAHRRRSWLRQLHRPRLLVHTRDGQTLDGYLVGAYSDGIALSPATLADGPHELDGEVWVPRDRVAWVQRPGRQDG